MIFGGPAQALPFLSRELLVVQAATFVCHMDFETKNDRDLKKTGVHAYSESPHAGIYVLRWRIVDESTRLIEAAGEWRPGWEDPWSCWRTSKKAPGRRPQRDLRADDVEPRAPP